VPFRNKKITTRRFTEFCASRSWCFAGCSKSLVSLRENQDRVELLAALEVSLATAGAAGKEVVRLQVKRLAIAEEVHVREEQLLAGRGAGDAVAPSPCSRWKSLIAWEWSRVRGRRW